MVRDRDLAHVPSEVADHLFGTPKWSADVDVPVAAGGIAEPLVPGVSWDTDAALAQERLEFGEELALEDRAEDVQGHEVTAAGDEALGAEPTAGDETGDVGMVAEALVPGVEHGEDSGEQPPTGRRLEDSLRDSGEERVQGMTALLSREETSQ